MSYLTRGAPVPLGALALLQPQDGGGLGVVASGHTDVHVDTGDPVKMRKG